MTRGHEEACNVLSRAMNPFWDDRAIVNLAPFRANVTKQQRVPTPDELISLGARLINAAIDVGDPRVNGAELEATLRRLAARPAARTSIPTLRSTARPRGNARSPGSTRAAGVPRSRNSVTSRQASSACAALRSGKVTTRW